MRALGHLRASRYRFAGCEVTGTKSADHSTARFTMLDFQMTTLWPNQALQRTAAPLFTSHRLMKFNRFLSAQRQPRRLSLSLGRSVRKKMHLASLIRDHLPLVVAQASHENENLHLSGNNWSFNSLSPWRITGSSGIVLSGSEFEDSNDAANSLCNHSIVGVAAQSRHHSGDPCFEMDDGRFLEVFSTHYLEPWVMHLPSGPILVASPTDAGATQIAPKTKTEQDGAQNP